MDWAQQNVFEERTKLREEREEDPSDEVFADALEKYLSPMDGLGEAPSTSARVPSRWSDLYDRTIERSYHREISAEIAALRGGAS